MRADVFRYTSSCTECQLRRRTTVFDRVPISAVTRPAAFGDVVSIDIIGPIDPSSSSGKRYVLCAIDQATKWPECVCLKTVSAKETANALLRIFSRIGIPHTLVSDNGTNFTAEVTREMLKTLGVQVRTSSPFHAEGNSLIERFQQTLKKMLRHIMSSHEPDRGRTKLNICCGLTGPSPTRHWALAHIKWCTAAWHVDHLACYVTT